jgi:hypothetical protein
VASNSSGFFDSIMNQLSNPMVAGGALGLAGGVAGALIPELTGANDFNVPKPDYGNIVIDQNEARSMIQGDMDALNNASGLEMTRIDASRGPAGAKLAAKQGAAAQIAGKEARSPEKYMSRLQNQSDSTNKQCSNTIWPNNNTKTGMRGFSPTQLWVALVV